MRGLRHGVVGIAVLTAALVGSALQAGATVERRTPTAVAAKAKKPKKPVSTCKLLTVAEITQALGTAPTEPAKADSVGECDYSSPTDYNFINISVTPLVNAALWKKSALSINVNIPVRGHPRRRVSQCGQRHHHGAQGQADPAHRPVRGRPPRSDDREPRKGCDGTVVSLH